jgi:hypothetical protein
MMKTTANFKSSAFPKYPNEDDEILNTDRWGKRLAEFIRDGLPLHGVQTTDIFCEDWGWLVKIHNDTCSVFVACGAMDQEMDEHAGNPTIDFSASVFAELSFFKRLFTRIDTKPALQQTTAALLSLLESSPEITGLTWSTV